MRFSVKGVLTSSAKRCGMIEQMEERLKSDLVHNLANSIFEAGAIPIKKTGKPYEDSWYEVEAYVFSLEELKELITRVKHDPNYLLF